MDKGYDGRAADIWSSGVILYVLLAGFLPFDESSMVKLFRKIVKAEFAYPSNLSAEAMHLLSIILEPDLEKRATVEQIRSHPWYRGVSMQQAEQEERESSGIIPHQRKGSGPTNGSSLSGDMSQAITWVEDKLSAQVKALGGLVGLGAKSAAQEESPASAMRSLQLDPTAPQPISAPSSVPSNNSLSQSLSPNSSPALAPQAAPSPQSGSAQARRKLPAVIAPATATIPIRLASTKTKWICAAPSRSTPSI